jgi:hypothetical protein
MGLLIRIASPSVTETRSRAERIPSPRGHVAGAHALGLVHALVVRAGR